MEDTTPVQPSAWSAHPCTGCSSKQSSGILEKPDLCSLVQGGSEKLSDEEIEATLEKVVRLLAYISDKDLFAEFFRKKLARRLLQEKSSSDEHERSILTRLKEQCGAQFTSKAGPPAGPFPNVSELHMMVSYLRHGCCDRLVLAARARSPVWLSMEQGCSTLQEACRADGSLAADGGHGDRPAAGAGEAGRV